MVPKGWEEKSLINLLDKIIDYRGQSVPKANKGIPLITARNVRFGYLDFSNQEYVDEGEFENWMSRGIPDVGDILFTTEAPLGMACRFPEKGRYAVAQRTVTLRTSNKLHSDFLLYFLLSEHGQRLIDIRSSGSTAKGIKSAELKKVKLLHPTCINEQQKIAKILSTWDNAISTTERLIDNGTQQKKALMQQLLTGKKRLLDESGKRFEGEWEEVKLGKVSEMNSGGTPKSTIPEYYDGDIPWVSIADMTKYGKWISTTAKYLTDSGLANSSARLYPKGTVLYAMYASIGECSIAQVAVSSSQAILGIRTKEKLNNLYLYYYLSNMKSKILLMGQQGTQSNLNAGMVKSFQMQLPSLKEQQKIATVLTNADKEIELLEQQLADLQQEKKALMHQLLTGQKRVVV